jgi:hypothetical protein
MIPGLEFEAPMWFCLLPVLAALGWWKRQLRLLLPLRALALILLACLLANPKLEQGKRSLDLFLLLDRSASTEGLIDENLPDWLRILEKAKPSADDEIRVVNFGSEVLLEGAGETAVYTGGRELTRTGLALQTALAVAREDRPSRALLLTDGYATEPLLDLADKLKAQGIPLDFRLVRDEELDDFRVARVEVPGRTLPGEPFLISVTCRGYADGEIPLEISREGEILLKTTVTLVDGVGRASFTDRLVKPGAYRYAARILPEKDAHPGNNLLEQWVEISGGPRILLLTRYLNDPLAEVLRRQGFSVELITETKKVGLGQLAGARVVIFNNVPAHQVPRDFQKALEFFVKDQGGGLLMVGGDASFGAGGYHESPVDALLPVSMELKSEHRKVTTALAVVMDRSGSMSARVGALTKMDLANNGAVNAINLLGDRDYISVTAVDSDPKTFVTLRQIAGNRADIITKTKSIRPAGGGIYVFNGLEAAFTELREAPSKTRHVILFSDAQDTEQPGDYRNLIQEMAAQGISISVIGLGTEEDADAPLLADIATRGKGRIFFTEDAAEVPVIFSQETVTIARSAFLKEITRLQATGKWSEVSPKEPEWLREVDGYNLSYLRPNATASLVSQDEYLAPLVAHQRIGAGRSMAVSFPLGGYHSERVREWGGYGDFAQTCVRWLMGLDVPAGLALKHRLKGNFLQLDLLYDVEKWGNTLMKDAPTVRLTEGNEEGFEALWERMAPGRFQLTRELTDGTVVRGSALVGEYRLPFGPFNVGSGAEWAFEREPVEELRQVSQASGGRELLDLQKAWVRPEQVRVTDLRVWLAMAILVCVLLDALITRTGWPLWSRQEAGVPPPRGKVQRPKKVRKKTVKKKKEPEESLQKSTTETRRARFERSKRRR